MKINMKPLGSGNDRVDSYRVTKICRKARETGLKLYVHAINDVLSISVKCYVSEVQAFGRSCLNTS